MSEKYVDKNLIKSLLDMIDSNSSDDRNLASQIFDNILNDDNDVNDFIKSYDEAVNTIIESEPIKGKKYKYNFNYIKLCMEHTKWRVIQGLTNEQKETR